MQVSERVTESGWTVLAATGRIDAHTAPTWERACHAAVRPGVRLALDLSAVDFMSSAGLRALLSTLKLIQRGGGELAVVGPQANVREVLAIAGFTGLFPIRDAAP